MARKRRRDLFSKKEVPQDEKAALFKCMAEQCGFRFGVPFHVIRDRADELVSGFDCPKCGCLYVRWENYDLFALPVDERPKKE